MTKIKKGQVHLGIVQSCRPLSPPEPDMFFLHILVLRWHLVLSSWFHHRKLHYIRPKLSIRQPCSQLEMSSLVEREDICNVVNNNAHCIWIVVLVLQVKWFWWWSDDLSSCVSVWEVYVSHISIWAILHLSNLKFWMLMIQRKCI